MTAVKFLTLLIFNTAEISLDSRLKYSKITHRYAKKLSIHLVLVLITSHWYRFHPFYLSILLVLRHKCQRVLTWASCTTARHAGSFDCLMTSLILLTIWTMIKGTVHLHGSSPAKVPTKPQRNKTWKMYAIKQIKICAEYRDMLPRPLLDLSGTPGLRPIGLIPGSWQTSLGLGSMSRYSAQILICILESGLWIHVCVFTWKIHHFLNADSLIWSLYHDDIN